MHFGNPRFVLCHVSLNLLVYVNVIRWTAEVTYSSDHNVTVLAANSFNVCEFLGLHRGAFEISSFRGCAAASMGDYCPTLDRAHWYNRQEFVTKDE
jgi:hypothetical protein